MPNKSRAVTGYLRYEALTDKLHSIAKAHPELVSLYSIGKSHQGRDIWVAAVTNRNTGEADSKPAMLVDGNIHAVELAASAAALYHLESLIDGYGRDSEVTRCLDTRAFYIVPRVNPDGAEAALADQPKFLRSGLKPYWHNDDNRARMLAEDIDGDGRILTMRVADPNGRWKKHAEDPRVMVLRDPVEEGGDYYRLFAEGPVEQDDPDLIPPVRPREGVDFNRNWPANWVGESTQQGAGRYSLSEQETAALARFISDHPNIFTWVAGHTFSGVLLRPGFSKPDEQLPHIDLTHYLAVGERGTELSSYPAKSAFTGFRINQGEEIHGSVEWGYNNFGIYTWIVEYWAPHQLAGVKIDNFAGWFFGHPGDDDLQMTRWGDQHLGEYGFVDWYPFEHPQLGNVELGGWDLIKTLYNPPPHMLADVIEPFPAWFNWQLLMSPLLAARKIEVQALGDNLWKIRAVLENQGWLPTYCSAQSIATKSVRGVTADISLPEGVTAVDICTRRDMGELAGRAFRPSLAVCGFMGDQTDDRAVAEWTLRGAPGSVVTLSARHDRAGMVTHDIILTTND